MLFEVKSQEYWKFFFLGIIANIITFSIITLEILLFWYRNNFEVAKLLKFLLMLPSQLEYCLGSVFFIDLIYVIKYIDRPTTSIQTKILYQMHYRSLFWIFYQVLVTFHNLLIGTEFYCILGIITQYQWESKETIIIYQFQPEKKGQQTKKLSFSDCTYSSIT